MSAKEYRINEEIRAKEVRLLDQNGEQKGVVPYGEALKLAQDAELDLVEIASTAVPPVCRIMDFGKYKFEQEKQQRDSKKKQKLMKIKEIRMQPKIDIHDLQFKTKHVKEFLDEGNKVKITVRFRGRELAHLDRGKMVLDKVVELLEGEYIMDKPASMEGRFMSMTIRPKK